MAIKEKSATQINVGGNENVQPKAQKSFWKKISKPLIVLLILVAVGSSASAVYFYNQWRMIKQNPNSAQQQQIKDLVDKVDKLIVLPQNETPSVATVTDLSKLKDQPFFANAKIGDEVLVYTNAKKAILYDPVLNKIVEVAPLTTQTQAATPTATTPTTTPSK